MRLRHAARMIRHWWRWTALAGLSVLGCGGRAGLQSESTSDVETPAHGFYSATWQTVSDSCQPAEPQGTTQELIGPLREGISVVFWQPHRQQVIPWDEPFMFSWSECGATIRLEVLERSYRSLVVDRRIDWANPAPCKKLKGLAVPSFGCSVHQITTYELEQACPSTRNGVTCP